MINESGMVAKHVILTPGRLTQENNELPVTLDYTANYRSTWAIQQPTLASAQKGRQMFVEIGIFNII